MSPHSRLTLNAETTGGSRRQRRSRPWSNATSRRGRSHDDVGHRGLRQPRRNVERAAVDAVVSRGRRHGRRVRSVLPAAEPGRATRRRRRHLSAAAPAAAVDQALQVGPREPPHHQRRRRALRGPSTGTSSRCRHRRLGQDHLGLPILVERAMYHDGAGPHVRRRPRRAGVTAPATSWFLAEGATGPFFDMFILLANPNAATDTTSRSTLSAAQRPVVTRQYSVAGNSRRTVYVDAEAPGLANGRPRRSSSRSTAAPIVVERAMWWPERRLDRGARQRRRHRHLVALGAGGRRSRRHARDVTYVLVANTSAAAGQVKVTKCATRIGARREERTYTYRPEPLQRGHGRPRSRTRRAAGSRCWWKDWARRRRSSSSSARCTRTPARRDLGGRHQRAGTPLFPDNTLTVTPTASSRRCSSSTRLAVQSSTRTRGPARDLRGPAPHGHDEQPAAQRCSFLNAGSEQRLTGNMVLDPGLHACGIHDHNDPTNDAVRAKVIVR